MDGVQSVQNVSVFSSKQDHTTRQLARDSRVSGGWCFRSRVDGKTRFEAIENDMVDVDNGTEVKRPSKWKRSGSQEQFGPSKRGVQQEDPLDSRLFASGLRRAIAEGSRRRRAGLKRSLVWPRNTCISLV